MIRHHLQVPRDDRGLLLIPEPADCAALVASNRRLPAETPLAELRGLARRELLAAAEEYTHHITGKHGETDPHAPLIFAGHQPEFFHTGVWVKNFLLHRVATEVGGRGVNLIVDNDAIKHTAMAVPLMRDGRLGTRQIPFISPPAGTAFEEDAPVSAKAIRRLIAEVAESLDTLAGESAFGEFAPLLEDATDGVRNIAEVVTVARRRWETQFGLANLELPVSRLAETESFRRFVLYVSARIDHIAPVHNAVLAEYRRLHKITNRANPMPDLAVGEAFHELPFWIWREGGRRQRLEAQRTAGGLEIQIDDRTEAVLTHEQLAHPDEGVAVLADLSARGFKIRPRALTLTWFVRVCVADAFIHGIGGAHYDTITDEILRRLHEITPPAVMIATGTLWMDLPRHNVSAGTARDLHDLIRELVYNPQRHIDADDGDVRQLVNAKQDLIRLGDELRARSAHSVRRRELFDDIRNTNGLLLTHCNRRPEQLRRQLERVHRRLDEEKIARNREYFFALPPRRKLEDFLLPVAGQ